MSATDLKLQRTIEVTVPLTDEFLSSILITAFDGNYGACWYWCDWAPGEDLEHVENDHGNSLWISVPIVLKYPEDWIEQDLRNEQIVAENGGVAKIRVSRYTLHTGILRILGQLMTNSNSDYDHLVKAIVEDDGGMIDGGMIDAVWADRIVQYAVFGEVVYA